MCVKLCDVLYSGQTKQVIPSDHKIYASVKSIFVIDSDTGEQNKLVRKGAFGRGKDLML
jgi:hypothetical protein